MTECDLANQLHIEAINCQYEVASIWPDLTAQGFEEEVGFKYSGWTPWPGLGCHVVTACHRRSLNFTMNIDELRTVQSQRALLPYVTIKC